MACVLMLAACSGDDAPPAFQRLRLQQEEPATREDVLVARFEPQPESGTLADWSTRAPRTDFQQSSGTPSLHLVGGESHYIEIPTGIELGRFDLLRVQLISTTALSIRTGLLRDGQVLAGSGGFGHASPGELTTIEMELKGARSLSGAPARLALSITGEELDWTIFSVELWQRPLEAWLPDVTQPGGVVLGTEARRAFGLSTRCDLTTEVHVPDDGRLSLSFAWARKLAPTGAEGLVRLSMTPVDGGEPREWELEIGEDAAWSDADLSLASLGGERVQLRLGLEVPGAEPALCALTEPVIYTRQASPPTVLLITSDTHRGDHLNTASDTQRLLTPTLDALAARGVRFGDCFVSSNVTLPSHAALFTGTSPRDTGVVDNRTTLEEDAPTLAEQFHSAGYLTYGVAGAWHLRPSWSGFDQGFDRMRWPTTKDSIAGDQLDALEAWLGAAEGRPLFVWLHLFDSHRPYTPPAPFDTLYYSEDRDPFAPSLPEPDFPAPPGRQGLRDIEYVFAQYKGEVSYLDSELGRLFEHDRFQTAIVALTSDHGEAFGTHGAYWNHVGLYPDVLHVPLILSWPTAPAGSESNRRVRQLDIGRTLLNLSELQAVPFPGTDLRDSLSLSGEARARTAPRFAISNRGAEASLNAGKWHLVLSLSERADESTRGHLPFELHRVELYDLDADPDCLTDLAAQDPARTRRMRGRLIAWLQAASSASWGRGAEGSAADQEFLAGLGYASGAEPTQGDFFPESCDCERCLRYQ